MPIVSGQKFVLWFYSSPFHSTSKRYLQLWVMCRQAWKVLTIKNHQSWLAAITKLPKNMSWSSVILSWKHSRSCFMGFMCCRSMRQWSVKPPSTVMSIPVMKLASSLARKATVEATSSGLPILLMTRRSVSSATISSKLLPWLSPWRCVASVRIGPGLTELTLWKYRNHRSSYWRDSLCAECSTGKRATMERTSISHDSICDALLYRLAKHQFDQIEQEPWDSHCWETERCFTPDVELSQINSAVSGELDDCCFCHSIRHEPRYGNSRIDRCHIDDGTASASATKQRHQMLCHERSAFDVDCIGLVKGCRTYSVRGLIFSIESEEFASISRVSKSSWQPHLLLWYLQRLGRWSTLRCWPECLYDHLPMTSECLARALLHSPLYWCLPIEQRQVLSIKDS